MKQDRPSFRAYRAHLYRQYFGRSFSAKPITGRNGESYAILKSTPYKLFWMIFTPLIFIITLSQGVQFGLIPLLAALGLYFIAATVRYFFASFVKLDSEVDDSGSVIYEMCGDASKDVRPSFSAYLKYVFVPTRNRYENLIKDSDGREYYRIPREDYYKRDYPRFIFFYSLGFSLLRVGEVMGVGFVVSACLIIGIMTLLLSPLSLYYLRFKRIDDQDNTVLKDDEPSSLLYKDEPSSALNKTIQGIRHYTRLHSIVSGIFAAAGLAVFVFSFIFIGMGSYESEEISIAAQPQTIEQVYDYSLSYTSESFEETDLVGFYIDYKDIDAMLSSKPSYWSVTFQDTPGLLPRPNETMGFEGSSKDTELTNYTYEEISPTYDPKLVTDPSEILAILISNGIISSDSYISSVTITTADYFTADRSIFKIHDPEECLVEIGSKRYIVNIKDKTARLE